MASIYIIYVCEFFLVANAKFHIISRSGYCPGLIRKWMRNELKLSKILCFKTDYHAVQLTEMPRIYVLEVRYLTVSLNEMAYFARANCCMWIRLKVQYERILNATTHYFIQICLQWLEAVEIICFLAVATTLVFTGTKTVVSRHFNRPLLANTKPSTKVAGKLRVVVQIIAKIFAPKSIGFVLLICMYDWNNTRRCVLQRCVP